MVLLVVIELLFFGGREKGGKNACWEGVLLLVGAARSDQLEFGPRPLARTDDLVTIGGRALVGDGLADATLGLEDEPRSILVDGEGPQIQVGRLLTDELNFLVGAVVALIEPEPAVRTVISLCSLPGLPAAF